MDLQEHGRAISGKLTSKLISAQSMRCLGGNTASTDMKTVKQDKSTSSDDTALVFWILVGGLILAVFLVAPTFVFLRIEGDISWSWGVVAIPVWVLDGLSLCIIWGMSFVNSNYDQSVTRKVFLTITTALSLMSEIFIVLKLDGNLDCSVAQAAIPYFIYKGMNLVDACFVSGNPAITIVSIVQVTLIALKVDGSSSSSWWTVFTPTWITFGLVFLVALILILISIFLPDDEDEKPLRWIVFGSIVAGLLFAPFVIAATRLESGSFSTFYIILPLYILAGGLILVGLGMLMTSKCFPPKISRSTDLIEYTAVEGQV